MQNSSQWQGRRVAVTGATGFIGGWVTQLLAERGALVRALLRPTSAADGLPVGVQPLVAPLEDRPALTRSMEGCDTLFHVAAAVRYGAEAELLTRTNLEGTANALAAARDARVRRVVVTSSIVAVGGSRWGAAVDERSPWNLGEARVPYVETKRAAERLALEANAAGIEVVVVNPTVVVGPGDRHGSEFGLLCRRFWQGGVPLCFPSGANFVDVRDVAAGHLRAATRGRPGQRYILGGEDRTWPDFFRTLNLVADRHRWFAVLPRWMAKPAARVLDRPGAAAGKRPLLTAAQARLLSWSFYASSAKAAEELGHRPRTLLDTLADTYLEWRGRRAARRRVA